MVDKQSNMVIINDIRKFGSNVLQNLDSLLSRSNVELQAHLMQSINTWMQKTKCRLPHSIVAEL